MNKILSFLLKNYDRSDTEIFLKAKFILITTLVVILTLLTILFYTVYLVGLDNSVVITEIFGFAIMLFALAMLVRGKFNTAIHIILVSGFATIWSVIFVESNISLVTKMDTIVFVIGLLAVMPLMFFKSKKPMVFYFIVNIFLFFLYIFYLHKTTSLTIKEQLDYFFDNLIVMTFVFFISVNLFSIYKQVLSSLNKELQERKHSEDINKTLFSISSAMNTTLNLKDLYKQIHNLLREILDVTNFFIAIVNEKDHTLYFPYYVDTVDDDFSPIMNFDPKKSLTGLVVSKRKSILLKQERLKVLSKGKGIWGPVPVIWMGVPLIIKDEVIGVIALQSYTDPHLYNEQDLQLLVSVSDQVAIAIDRKRSEAALRESEKKYRHLFNNAPAGMYEIDFIKIKFINVNEAMCEYSGYTEDEFLSMNPLDLLTDDSRTLFLARLETLGTDENISDNVEYNIIKKNGQELCVILSSDFIYDNGKLKGARVVAHDITDRKKIESMMIQSQKMEAIGTLAGGIAHDFNNILSGIFGYSQLAKMHIDDQEKTTKNIDQVIKGAQKATDLVKQILTFSKKSEHKMQPLKIFIEIKETVRLLRSSIPSTIEIKEKINSAATVLADLTQIHQVVMNLCTNAYHAMREKGGVLSVSLEETQVSDTNSIPDLNILPGTYLRLDVSDTGHGISPETLDRIFEPYFTTKEIGEGTGLGLAVVIGIVEEHNGYIKVYSEIGKGSTVHVYFPVLEDQSDSNSLQEEKNTIQGGTERIIIVDDETTILTSTQELLKDYGYTVVAFSDSEQAITEFKKTPHQFDLIITDMTMPKMTGEELSAEILKTRIDMPIMLCTGYSETFTEDKALELGIIKYIQKPIESETLLVLIREVLDKKQT